MPNVNSVMVPQVKVSLVIQEFMEKKISYVRSRLQTYRSGKEVGANSALMIMMAKPLTDEEIENLAAYLKDARPE